MKLDPKRCNIIYDIDNDISCFGNVMMTDTHAMKRKKRRFVGSDNQFPGKLHDMLDYIEKMDDDANPISWNSDGKTFNINDSEKLQEILPLFFGHNKFRSFQRQLSFWSFTRILKGPNKGALMHPYFIKGEKDFCRMISRSQFRSRSLKETDGTYTLAEDKAEMSSASGDRSPSHSFQSADNCSSQTAESYNDKPTETNHAKAANHASRRVSNPDEGVERQRRRNQQQPDQYRHQPPPPPPSTAAASAPPSPNRSPGRDRPPRELRDGDRVNFAGKHFYFVDVSRTRSSRSRRRSTV